MFVQILSSQKTIRATGKSKKKKLALFTYMVTTRLEQRKGKHNDILKSCN